MRKYLNHLRRLIAPSISKITKMTSRVVINGVEIQSARSISITQNGKRIYVDGQEVSTGDAKEVKIEVHGNLGSLDADACETITVTGNVGNVETMSGNVKCGDVTGSVQTMSGSISAGKIAGSPSSMSGGVFTG